MTGSDIKGGELLVTTTRELVSQLYSYHLLLDYYGTSQTSC
jgi:hypothetical protein